jgi:hypothetical protein
MPAASIHLASDKGSSRKLNEDRSGYIKKEPGWPGMPRLFSEGLLSLLPIAFVAALLLCVGPVWL